MLWCPYSKKREGVRQKCGNEENEEQKEDEEMGHVRARGVMLKMEMKGDKTYGLLVFTR